MPNMTKYRKVKGPRMLAIKGSTRKNFQEYKSIKPFCQKLKNNNHTLAKALSKEKQECQSLFSQNVALMAEVQNLGLACNKRDAVIAGVLDNSKEILNFLVTMTGYVTKTISSCQEFFANTVTNTHITSDPANRRDSTRRLSMKSPAKGVVKPMVSGYTITKPTINLSRVNMERMNNPSGLSVIEEERTSMRSQETLSPASNTLPSTTQRRSGAARTCRMPERIRVSSPRSNNENERRLSRNNRRRSGRISGGYSRPNSARLSGDNITRRSLSEIEYKGSPRVKLTDVSKLLHNSQTINVRLLNDNLNNSTENVNRNNNEGNRSVEKSNVVPETPPTDDSELFVDHDLSEKVNEDQENEPSNTRRSLSSDYVKFSSNGNMSRDSNVHEDPLEGPSWLYNSQSNSSNATDDLDKSLNNTDLSRSNLEKTTTSWENNKQNLPEAVSHSHLSDQNPTNGRESNFVTTRRGDGELKFPEFVSQRRMYHVEELEDDVEDFTLFYTQHPRNMNFDFNELKLPVVEESLLRKPEVCDLQPEVTTTLQHITQTLPQIRKTMMEESICGQLDMNLSMSLAEESAFIPDKESPPQRNIKTKRSSADEDFSNYMSRSQKKKVASDKDPSAAKVVVQKLKDELCSPNIKYSSPTPGRVDDSSDYDTTNSMNSPQLVQRLRRKRVQNMREPTLNRKLRRQN